jgi:hypothetical protein
MANINNKHDKIQLSKRTSHLCLWQQYLLFPFLSESGKHFHKIPDNQFVYSFHRGTVSKEEGWIVRGKEAS